MSRLFDTLEKIRERETGLAAAGTATVATPAGRPRLLTFLAVVLLLLLVLALAAVNLRDGKHARHAAVNTEPARPAPPAPPAPRTGPGHAASAAELNDRGCRLLARKRYWQAIMLFDAAAAKAPNAPEPLINAGVALAELGLFAPAAAKFHRAEELAPEHPALKKNLAILERHGLGIHRLPAVIRVTGRGR